MSGSIDLRTFCAVREVRRCSGHYRAWVSLSVEVRGAEGNTLVVKRSRRSGRGILAALFVCSNDGLEIGALPPLLAAAAVCSLGYLLGLVDGGFLDVGAIHGVNLGFPATRGLR